MAEESENGTDPRLLAISASIRVVPHFPKPGIMFNDITPLLLRPEAFKGAIEIFAERYRDMEIHAVAGIEARGFMFGSPLALAIGAKFVPLRKPGKLPGEIISEAYALEYGTDCLEMHVGAVQPGERVLVIDDLVATGGTLCAAIKLVERAGAEVVECACLIGLPKFKETRVTIPGNLQANVAKKYMRFIAEAEQLQHFLVLAVRNRVLEYIALGFPYLRE